MPICLPPLTGLEGLTMHIEIDEISKEFGTTAALHPVSLAIPSGALERVASLLIQDSQVEDFVIP